MSSAIDQSHLRFVTVRLLPSGAVSVTDTVLHSGPPRTLRSMTRSRSRGGRSGSPTRTPTPGTRTSTCAFEVVGAKAMIAAAVVSNTNQCLISLLRVCPAHPTRIGHDGSAILADSEHEDEGHQRALTFQALAPSLSL